jgi:hypothetical protein
MKNIKYLFIFFLFPSVFFISCKKDISPATLNLPDSTTIAGFKDSTLLIRSISKNLHDSATGAVYDSSTEYYFYDTLNKKVIISQTPVSSSTQSYNGVELNYDSKGLLVHIAEKYLSAPADNSSISSIDYTYDASNAIRTSSIKLFSGMNYGISFSKTSLPSGGYQQSWTDTYPYYGQPDTTYYTVDFKSNGKLMDYAYSNGNNVSAKYSISYDPNDNITKVTSTELFYLKPPYTVPDSSISVDFYTFNSRDTKGDQLYNLNKIIYNGIAEMPHSVFRLSGPDEIEEYAYQYSKYPALSTNVYRTNQGNGSYISKFNSIPQYDSKNRLIKYRFFFNDVQLDYTEWAINYYK